MANTKLTKNKDHANHSKHKHTLYSELICHFPYAVFSVALSLIILSLLDFLKAGSLMIDNHKVFGQLFHSFHFIHIVFAAAGSLITYYRFSKNVLHGLITSVFSASVFCILSDVLIPYVGGQFLGVDMHLHICFISELPNILPFLFMGLLTGLAMTRHHGHSDNSTNNTKDEFKETGLWSHFAHILVSSLASSFYLVSHGFSNWSHSIGLIFLLLIIAVVVPCTLSDVVVPMFVATKDRR